MSGSLEKFAELITGMDSVEDLNNLKTILADMYKPKKEKLEEEEHLLHWKEMNFYEVVETKQGAKNVPLYNQMARYFQKILKFRCDDSYSAFYENDHYSYVSSTKLKNEIVNLTAGKVMPTHLDQFYKVIKATCYYRKDSFVHPDGLINLKNGVWNTKTKELTKHSHKHNFTYKLNHDFNPNARCDRFIEFLNNIFYEDQELVNLMGEILGYTIIGGYPFKHKAFMFYGSGRNGKSTLLEVITALLGRQNVSSVSMKLIDKPFSTVRMDGKLANIVEESPNKIDPEAFKNIAAGGTVTAANKRMDEFDLVVKCRLFFACNEFPHFKDATKGNRDRLVIVPFEKYISESERDPLIKDKLIAEMSGILNFALEGLARFTENNYQFSKSEKVDKTLDAYIKDSDSAYQFLSDYLVYMDGPNGADAFIKNEDIFKNYNRFCKKLNYFPCSYPQFCRRAVNYYRDAYSDNGLTLTDGDRQKKVDANNLRGIKRFSMITVQD